jgi:hypothetical protein
MALFNKYNIYIYLPEAGESVLGKTLREMVGELKYGKPPEPMEMVKLSPEWIARGKEIIKRLKIKYPLKKDKFGKMMKP